METLVLCLPADGWADSKSFSSRADQTAPPLGTVAAPGESSLPSTFKHAGIKNKYMQ